MRHWLPARGRTLIGCTIVATGALGLLAGVAVTRGSADPGGPIPTQAQEALCGIARPVDEVLECPAPATAAQAAAATSTENTTEQPSASTETTAPTATTAGAVSAPLLQPAPPVVRSSTRPVYVPNKVLVRFAPGTPASKISALLARLGAKTDTTVPGIGVRAVIVSPAQRAAVLAGLDRSPIVAYAEKDLVFHSMGTITPDDTFFSQQWGLKLSDFAGPWGKKSGSRSVVVAVVDTGVDASQPDLAGVVLPGFNVIANNTDTSDQNGHGTATAGVIAALANNGIGGAGVCSACLILPIKAMNADGTGDTSQVAAGIVKAANLGAKVINLSLGAPQGLDALQQAVNYATSKGAIVLAAAGNSGVSTTFYPAGYANVISVAGSNPTDRLYGWSNFGSWVSVAAPGCNVAPLIQGGYGLFCGTSSATPLVAGLVGLALSTKRGATRAQVTKAIDLAAKRIQAKVRFGRINAGGTLARVLGA